MSDETGRLPLIGEKAPEFKAETTQGTINFPKDYEGKWVIFFSHPADFTPVCTTEFMTFASMAEEFKALNAELLGLSTCSRVLCLQPQLVQSWCFLCLSRTEQRTAPCSCVLGHSCPSSRNPDPAATVQCLPETGACDPVGRTACFPSCTR